MADGPWDALPGVVPCPSRGRLVSGGEEPTVRGREETARFAAAIGDLTIRETEVARIDGASREVLEAAEWVTIASTGPDGAHLSATWGDYVRGLGIDWEAGELLVPMGGMTLTEANLAADNRIEVLAASRAVEGSLGPGQGCLLRGRGEVEEAGARADAVRARFPWARAVLVVRADEVKTLL